MDELKRTQLEIHELHSSIQSFIEHHAPHAIYRAPIIDWHHPEAYCQTSISGLNKFRGTVQTEKEHIDRLVESAIPPKELATNAPHLLAVWEQVQKARWPLVCVSQILELGEVPGTGGQVKVDVVADGGREWVKVNTMKESRLMAEFREQDSYVNSNYDSDSDSYSEASSSSSQSGPSRPRPRPRQLTNSAIEQAAALCHAAQVFPRLAGTPAPSIKYVLNRLEEEPEGGYSDPRVKETFEAIRALGVDLVLASDRSDQPERVRRPPPRPTNNILLDLSVVVALCCDSTHRPLPSSEAELDERFRSLRLDGETHELDLAPYTNVTKDLRDQLEWEMQHPLIQEMQERLSGVEGAIEFWVTEEVKSRLPAIVEIIGGDEEKRRAKALFGDGEFWEGSRWEGKAGVLEGIRVRVLDDETIDEGGTDEKLAEARVTKNDGEQGLRETRVEDTPFHRGFIQISRAMLEMVDLQSSSTPPNPVLTTTTPENDDHADKPKPKPKPKLKVKKGKKSRRPQLGFSIASRLPSAHTLRTFIAGFERGWTVLTNNRGAVGKVIRELRVPEGIPYDDDKGRVLTKGEDRKEQGQKGDGEGKTDESQSRWTDAAIWVVNPSSLSEWRRKEVEEQNRQVLARDSQGYCIQ